MTDPVDDLNNIHSQIADTYKTLNNFQTQRMLLDGTIENTQGRLRLLLLQRDDCLERLRRLESLKETFNHEDS